MCVDGRVGLSGGGVCVSAQRCMCSAGSDEVTHSERARVRGSDIELSGMSSALGVWAERCGCVLFLFRGR